MSREQKTESEYMPFEIRMRASCGPRGDRVNRRFRPDTLLDRLTENRLPRKSAFTRRKASFKDTEGRKYFRDAPFEVRASEQKLASGWYHLVLPVRGSTEHEKVSWPKDDEIFIGINEHRTIQASIERIQKPENPKNVVARVYLVFGDN